MLPPDELRHRLEHDLGSAGNGDAELIAFDNFTEPLPVLLAFRPSRLA